MVAADTLNVFVIDSVPLAWWLGMLTVPHVLLAAFLAQLLFTFRRCELRRTSRPRGPRANRRGNAAVWGFGGVLDLLMPAVAGAALAVFYPAQILTFDAVSYGVSALVVRTIRRPLSVARDHPDKIRMTDLWADVREGLAFLWGHGGTRSNTIVCGPAA